TEVRTGKRQQSLPAKALPRKSCPCCQQDRRLAAAIELPVIAKANGGMLAVHPLPYAVPATTWFERIRHLPLPVLLDSGRSEHPASRYDILAADPHCTLRTQGNCTTVSEATGRQEQIADEDPFAIL